MHEAHDRRSALARIASSASAIAIAARELSSTASAEADADAETRKKRKAGNKAPRYTWDLPWGPAVFTSHPGGDSNRYHAVVGAFGSGTWVDYRSGRKRKIDDGQLERIILKQSNGGKMCGRPQLRLAGINWRIQFAEYDPASRSLRMDLRVCDSNPNARPGASYDDAAAAGPPPFPLGNVGGCTCDRYSGLYCYFCVTTNSLSCAASCEQACQGGC